MREVSRRYAVSKEGTDIIRIQGMLTTTRMATTRSTIAEQTQISLPLEIINDLLALRRITKH